MSAKIKISPLQLPQKLEHANDFPAVKASTQRLAEFKAKLDTLAKRETSLRLDLQTMRAVVSVTAQAERFRQGETVDYSSNSDEIQAIETQFAAIEKERAVVAEAIRLEQLEKERALVAAVAHVEQLVQPQLDALNREAAIALFAFGDAKQRRLYLASTLAHLGYTELSRDVASTGLLPQYGGLRADSPLALILTGVKHLLPSEAAARLPV